MCLSRINQLKTSLSVRLTLWYAVIFTVSAILVLAIFYRQVISIAMARVDEELAEEVREFADLYTDAGIDAVKMEMIEEIESDDENKIFRLLSFSGQVLATSGLAAWGKSLIPPPATAADVPDRNYTFKTMSDEDRESRTRWAMGKIGPNEIMQIGESLEDVEEYLDIFKKLMLMLLFPLILLSAAVGWFMARQSLSGVDQVTRTAEKITAGDYGKRVRVEKRFNEIERLSNAFNQMVDRLQTLLQGMREMTDNIAHDLRSPLTRIRGIAEMTLIGEQSEKKYQEMAVNTVDECDNLIHMINTMLDITEAEAGIGELEFEEINLNSLIESACGLFHTIAGEKNIRLVANLPDLPAVRCDKSKLQRLFTNLLENAIKYTPENGRVAILVDHGDRCMNIRIEDTGIGISEEDLPKIFERFYRCDQSRTQGGVGLGLSLAKAIAERLGGSISVNSIFNQGSVFTLTVPR
ncbi:MAG: HAMP domain-containing protein [Desulfobacteraceae bacterium]|nr:HAMP domain-containing protein [Desulfobacteraceae bacterium]